MADVSVQALTRNSAAQRVTLNEAAPACRLILRGAAAAVPASQAFGLALPEQPMTSATNEARAAFWLGPDEWLLIAPDSEVESVLQALEAALADVPHALVDVSHRQNALIVEGPAAASALNSAVPLDLDPAAFPVGRVVRTIFEKAEIVLWRMGPERFRIEVWRSFAPYVRALLEEARDHDVGF